MAIRKIGDSNEPIGPASPVAYDAAATENTFIGGAPIYERLQRRRSHSAWLAIIPAVILAGGAGAVIYAHHSAAPAPAVAQEAAANATGAADSAKTAAINADASARTANASAQTAMNSAGQPPLAEADTSPPAAASDTTAPSNPARRAHTDHKVRVRPATGAAEDANAVTPAETPPSEAASAPASTAVNPPAAPPSAPAPQVTPPNLAPASPPPAADAAPPPTQP